MNERRLVSSFTVIKGKLVCRIFFETYFGELSVPDLIMPTLSEIATGTHVHHSDHWIWLWPFWLWPFWSVAVLDFQCGRFGLTCGRFGCGRFGLWPFWM